MTFTVDEQARALRTLALAKLLKDQITRAEREAKALLEQTLDNGDRKTVTDFDGRDIGTVSRGKERKKPGTGLTITDPIALAAWCDARDIDHGGKPSVEFPEWFTAPANLDSLIRMSGGEMPDGLEDTTEIMDGTVTVRQSTSQADTLMDNIDVSAAYVALRDALAMKQIESGEQE